MEEAQTESAETNGAVVTIANGEEKEPKQSYDGAAIRGARAEDKDDAKPAAEEPKRPGYDPLDFETATPDQVKERVNYLYRQVKDGSKTINQYRSIAEQQSRQIEELTKGFNGVVNHLTTKSLDDSEEDLTTLMNSAFERGDNKGYLDAQKKLINLGVEKRLVAEKQRQPQQVQQVQQLPQQSFNSASQIAGRASEQGELSDAEFRATEAWQNERDANGEFIRPWARTADVNNPDPNFSAAFREAQGVFTNPRFANLSYEDKLAEVDRRMGVAKRVTNQTVSAGGLTGRNKTAKISLSADIEKMVRHTKWGGSKYKTDDERLDAYRKQLSGVRNSQKGTR